MKKPKTDPQSGTTGRDDRRLGDLLPATAATGTDGWERTRITAVTSRSTQVQPGSVFVAMRGTHTDGHAFVRDALLRGAAAVVIENDAPADVDVSADDDVSADNGVSADNDVSSKNDVPVKGGAAVIRVPDTRRALAAMAAAWHGHPADRLTLIGITGTLGKTSTLAMLEEVLMLAGHQTATIGSLGLRIHSETREETAYTAPDPLVLHGELARAADEGCTMGVMEVTSHALAQERVAGLWFKLGIFTNLLPLEHEEYHGSFGAYVEAKRRFFRHLPSCAPLIFNADDRTTRRIVHDFDVEAIGCGTSRTAQVRIEPLDINAHGTKLILNVRRTMPRLDGGFIAPLRLPLEVRLLGRSNLLNAGLAATAGLCAGAEPEVIREALSRIPTPRRRMQILHRGRFTLLDDTVGHPDSVSAVFEIAAKLAPGAIHIVFAVRGSRGDRINRELARSLGVWCTRCGCRTLVITRSAEAASDRNRVTDPEYDAFTTQLRDARVNFMERERLDDAIVSALKRARDGDLVLLLGAQGMNRGHEIAADWLATNASLA